MKLKKSLSALLVLMLLAIISVSVSAKTKITYSNFIKIKMGSSYSQVEKIIGKGKKLKGSSMKGTYIWYAGSAYISIVFEGNKVVIKGQTGLYKSYAKVTKAKYNKLKSGMSYSQVKDILGKGGQLTAQNESDNKVMKEYYWGNKNGDYVQCGFINNKLNSKSDYGL